jgi:hypothetical protein
LLRACMARGIHGLPKVSPRPAMPDPSRPCRRATPKIALWPFLCWSAHREASLQPFSTPLDTPRRTDLLCYKTCFILDKTLEWRGVSKGVENGRRLPNLRAGYPYNSCKAISWVASSQGIDEIGMAGPGKTLGSPWLPLAIRPWAIPYKYFHQFMSLTRCHF